jgi:hypothetical protein
MTAAKHMLRRFPIVCFLAAFLSWPIGRIRSSKSFLGKTIQMEDGRRFVVFRHIRRDSTHKEPGNEPAVMVVRFRFAKHSQPTNRRLSLIPVPLIVGYPGFHDKVWMVDEDDGYWQGAYQWESEAAVEAYKRSFVLRVMNRRAQADSVTIETIPNTSLQDYLRQRLSPVPNGQPACTPTAVRIRKTSCDARGHDEVTAENPREKRSTPKIL